MNTQTDSQRVALLYARITGTDADTGRAIYSTDAVMTNAPCTFAVVSAQQVTEVWGDSAAPTETNQVHGSLTLPSWAPAIENPADALFSITRYPGVWRIVASRPGIDWTTYLLAMS